MAAIAAGQYRFAMMNSQGLIRTFSEQFAFDVFDNAAPPRVIFNRQGTADDQAVWWDQLISGPKNELLVLQFLDVAAHTWVTANFTVRFNTRMGFRDERDQVVESDNPLLLVDRVTRTGTTGRQDPNGINDNPATVANVWGSILAFKPLTNQGFRMKGYQLFISDGV